MGERGSVEGAASGRYGRETVEFGRVANLSDGVFAIALTFLVFTLDADEVSLDRILGVVLDQPGQLTAFVLSFVVIANFWWIHHRFLGNLGALEPGLILLNLALLGSVAVLPFMTSLLGRDPTVRGSAVPYIGLLSLIALLFIGLVLRAERRGAWTEPMPRGLLPWVLAGWGANAIVILIGLGLAFLVPVAGLAMLLLTWPVELLVAWRAPEAYREWA